ncbi:hypothetical protein HQ447_06015 [bacterium]|nr:hypothetical protein [bacterium]
MNRTQLIFTHGAVFSVGIAAALIANGLRDPQASSLAAGGEPGSRSRSARSSAALEPEGTPRPANGSSRSQSKRGEKPAVEQLANIIRITDASERQRALMDLMDTLGPAEFAAVAEQFRELDHLDNGRGEYDLILRGWAKADPLGAIAYADLHPNSQAARSTILTTWAGNDAAAAERWALDHHDGNGPNPHLAAVIRGIAANDVASASRLAQSMPLSRERGEAVNSITRALFLQGTDSAMAFPASISDEALRGGFVAAIAARMIDKDVNAAAAWVASMKEGDVQNRAARSVADALARVDPKTAATWVRSLQPEAQAEAARGVIPIMSSKDIAGTATWVSGLAGTPQYDSMVEEFVWSCNTRAPEQSAAWIQGVSDPQQQRRLYQRMLGEWAQKDAAAVKQWVTSNTVPPEIARRFAR